ncbi:MAG: phosphoadenosine phosphosulfate reductase family protein [Desulfobacterales bacterium]|nr:phosphoadenosine phosphosulfate reductase family protein [Desulfobacterales bacterium]
MQLDLFEQKIDRAIRRLKENEPDDEPYYGATSGGKDSVAIMRLAEMAGVEVEWYCNLTTVDPPELIRFIRKNYSEVRFNKPEMNMWQLIVSHRMPPTRKVRYCCEYLKEQGGNGRVVITGVRRSESAKRSKRQDVECNSRKKSIVINPIIDWSSHDVWSFIREQNIPYCKLYDEGFKRLGCVGCPMAGKRGMEKEFARWPHFKRLYIKAFRQMVERRVIDGLETEWKTGEEVFDWWIANKREKPNKQIGIFD